MGAAERGWLAPALAWVLAITALRIVLLAFDRTDLFVDEAQYWLWGQSLDLGYYSKPPMIAWVIRAFTEVCGDGPFCIRLPGPLFHAATALILGGIARPLAGDRAALAVAVAYATLPMVALGSLLISTDTILFPFLALALMAYLACLRGAGSGVALLGGVALGLGFLSKYAAVYYLLCALLALGLRPRPGLPQALAFLAGFALAASPNVVWNLAHGFSTVEHTLDNADWLRDPGARAGLNLRGLAEFLAAQFAVVGPVLFAGLLGLLATWRRRPPETRRLLWFVLPILALVSGQALLSHAYANWAATAYLAGVLAVVPWLLGVARRWLAVSFAINGALCLALPLAAAFPERLTLYGQPLLARYLGRGAMSVAILTAAQQAGLDTVVSGNRDILADLFYTGRDSGLTFRAVAPAGRPRNHYEQRYPFTATSDRPVLLVAPLAQVAPCPEAVRIGAISPDSGAYRTHPQALWRIAPACLAPG